MRPCLRQIEIRAALIALRALVATCAVGVACRTESASFKPSIVASAGEAAAHEPNARVRDDDGHAVPRDAGFDASADVRRGTLSIAPVLDSHRGGRAVKNYREFLSAFCASLARAGARARALRALKGSVGLSGDADGSVLCANASIAAATALASGSFFKPAADEVLLAVEGGQAIAGGGSTKLALMRADGSDYRLIRHLLLGTNFEAPLRLSAPEGPDVLMLCDHAGRQGVYPATCGFLGQGTFGEGKDADEQWKDELHLVSVAICGPTASVSLGDLGLRGNRLSVGLVVREGRNVSEGPEKREEGFPCEKELPGAREKRVTVAYEVDVGGAKGPPKPRVRLVTPMPREVTEILHQY